MKNESLKPRGSLIKPGDDAPDFTLLDQHRQPWTLSGALGKGDVVLSFFPFAFTEVGSAEMECITKEMHRWTSAGAQVVGVSCDSFAALKAWGEQMGFKHPLLADMHREVSKAYGLYWADLNVSQRGTIIIARDEGGHGHVKWSQAREPKNAFKLDEVMAAMA